MLSLRKPSAEFIRPFLAAQANLPFTDSAISGGTPSAKAIRTRLGSVHA